MRNLKKELEVDFIGGLNPLTKEEEKAISNFIKKKKDKELREKIKSKTARRKKVSA